MRRSGFRRKTYEEVIANVKAKGTGLKRSNLARSKKKMAKVGKLPISKIQREIWEHCKRIVRARDINKDGTWNCFTCGRLIDHPSKAQTGHFIPKASCGAYLKYDLRNLHIQDYWCNINLGGNGTEYYRKMVEKYGQSKVDEIFLDKQKIVKAYDYYVATLEQYKNL